MASPKRPLILVADDDPNILRLMEHHLNAWGYRVATAVDKVTLFTQLSEQVPTLLLLDLRFGEHDGVELLGSILQLNPHLSVAMLTAHGSIDTAVSAIKLGAFEYLTKPPDLQRLQVIIRNAVEMQNLNRKVHQLEQVVQEREDSRPIWGESDSIDRLRDLIAAVAPTDATVLILGESGTGKELVARAIHEQSPRRPGPFIPVNMAAMPRELMESTLFGHEKGAFTGADDVQRGCCEAADKGTLFLDEIGELELDLQAKMLRFLQERTVQRVGSSKATKVDVRIVTATNRDLEDMVRAGRLREDLYYRLNVIPIHVPPLRDRTGDVEVLTSLFLRRFCVRHRKSIEGFSDEALAALVRYTWPGNIRQLENMVERMVILSRGNTIGLQSVPQEILSAPDFSASREQPVHERLYAAAPVGGSSSGSESILGDDGGPRNMEDIERDAILAALEKSKGNVGDAARILGLGQATVYRKLKRYGISAKDYS